MKKIPDSVFNKIENLSKTVISDLRKKGYVIPSKQRDGSIKFDNFTVKKDKKGFYYIIGSNNHVYVENINLPQTAILIANNLALGKILDKELAKIDREYGHMHFEEELYQNALKRKKITVDELVFYETKYQIAKGKSEFLKSRIVRSFEKLNSIR